MEYVTYGLCALAGGLVSYLLFNRGPGPFEKTIWAGLYQGKRVVVCVADDAYIFELIGNRLRITQGTSSFEENPYGVLADDVDSVSDPKSSDPGSPSV